MVSNEEDAEAPVAEAAAGGGEEEEADASPTFPLDVGSAGADRLRCTVKTKLSEFMGSYTDDVLAEYVVVLVGHGKQRKQATADLEAFLGGQSEAFVSWLWEHLIANLDDYTQASEQDQAPELENQQKVVVSDEGKEDQVAVERAEGTKDDNHTGHEESRLDAKRSRSPEPWSRRRRTRTENKVEASPPVETSAPAEPPPPRLRASRRLLEFALRDAVAPASGASRRTADAASKRLRSVVATDQEKSSALLDSNGKLLKARPTIAKQSKNSPAMMIALKAAAAAAEDVSNRKPVAKSHSRLTSSVWDRLGGKSDEEADAADEITEKMEYVHVDDVRNSKVREKHLRRSSAVDRLRAPTDTATTAEHDHYSYEDGQNDQQFERQIEEVPESLSRKEPKRHAVKKERRQRKPEEYRRVSHSDKQKDGLPLERRSKALDANHHVEHEKCMDLPNGKELDSQDVTEMKKRMRQVELEVSKLRTKQVEASTKGSEKATAVASNPPIVPPASQAGISAGIKPQPSSEDAETKVIVVTNVHFATTKEAISTHFASCGEVVKVTILTDGVSGKPKGSAYVEFSSKEAADKALAMNESCLLSRPLRVVRKDSSNLAESSSSPVIRAPIIRPVRMPIRAFPRAAFMRGSPYGMRPPQPRLLRPSYPVAAPHLQWKRDGSSTAASQLAAMKNGFRSSVGPIRKRSLSYVRPLVPPTETTAAAAAAAAISAVAAAATGTDEKKG